MVNRPMAAKQASVNHGKNLFHLVFPTRYQSITVEFNQRRNLWDPILSRKIKNINLKGVSRKVMKWMSICMLVIEFLWIRKSLSNRWLKRNNRYYSMIKLPSGQSCDAWQKLEEVVRNKSNKNVDQIYV